MFAVMVKRSMRKKHCVPGLVWAPNETDYYVAKRDRGLWPTREEAEAAVTETWEVVVEVKDEPSRSV
jgi:3'-phosphoadenosine 5'-phosphosulfate (PAPS) 3'-phosphatase